MKNYNECIMAVLDGKRYTTTKSNVQPEVTKIDENVLPVIINDNKKLPKSSKDNVITETLENPDSKKIICGSNNGFVQTNNGQSVYCLLFLNKNVVTPIL